MCKGFVFNFLVSSTCACIHFVFCLLCFSFFFILLLLLGQIVKKGIGRSLCKALLVLSSSLVFCSFPKDFDVLEQANKRQQLCNGVLWGKCAFPWGSKELAPFFYTISSCPCAVLGFVMLLGWTWFSLEGCSWIWMFCFPDGHCPGCLTCNSHSPKDWIPELVHGFEVG